MALENGEVRRTWFGTIKATTKCNFRSTIDTQTIPTHLKYIYFGEYGTLPVIIAKNLSPFEEVKLVRVLWEYMTAIRWTIVNI